MVPSAIVLDESIYTAVPTLLVVGLKASGKATAFMAFPVGTAVLCQKVIITTLLIRTAWPLVMPYADRSSSPQAILVLNTVIKMQKNEFCLNFYTAVLNTNLINPLLVRTFAYAQTITLAPNDGQEIQIPITVPEGYIFLCVTNVKSNGEIAYSYYTGSVSNVLTCFVGNDRNEQKIIPQGISADVLFMKKWW